MKAISIFLGLVVGLLVFNSQSTLAESSSEPQFLNVVVYLQPTGKTISLERQTASVQTNKIALGFGGAKQIASVAGSKSTVQLTTGEVHEFAVKLPSGIDPSKFELFKLDSVEDHREVVLGQVGYISKGSGMGRAPFDIASFGSSYKFITAASLPPGEYGFSANDSQDMYCFENK